MWEPGVAWEAKVANDPFRLFGISPIELYNRRLDAVAFVVRISGAATVACEERVNAVLTTSIGQALDGSVRQGDTALLLVKREATFRVHHEAHNGTEVAVLGDVSYHDATALGSYRARVGF